MTGVSTKMTVSMDVYDRRTTIEINDEAGMETVLEVFHALVLSAGYQEGSWRDAIIDLANTFEGEAALEEIREHYDVASASVVSGCTCPDCK